MDARPSTVVVTAHVDSQMRRGCVRAEPMRDAGVGHKAGIRNSQSIAPCWPQRHSTGKKERKKPSAPTTMMMCGSDLTMHARLSSRRHHAAPHTAASASSPPQLLNPTDFHRSPHSVLPSLNPPPLGSQYPTWLSKLFTSSQRPPPSPWLAPSSSRSSIRAPFSPLQPPFPPVSLPVPHHPT